MPLTAPRKTIKFPGAGDQLTIRRLGPADYTELGGIPDTLIDLGKRQLKGQELDTKQLSQLDPKTLTFTQRLAVQAIVEHPKGAKLVFKRPEDCEPGDFSFYDLEAQDQEFLVREVFAFTGEDTASAKSFPKPKK